MRPVVTSKTTSAPSGGSHGSGHSSGGGILTQTMIETHAAGTSSGQTQGGSFGGSSGGTQQGRYNYSYWGFINIRGHHFRGLIELLFQGYVNSWSMILWILLEIAHKIQWTIYFVDQRNLRIKVFIIVTKPPYIQDREFCYWIQLLELFFKICFPM